MTETKTAAKSPELSPQPRDMNEAIDRMLSLRWPNYTDPDHYADTIVSTLQALEDDSDQNYEPTLVNGFYIDVVNPNVWEATDPVEIRRMTAEMDAKNARKIARLLADGPFGACNPHVANAFRDNINDATNDLLAALDIQDGGEPKYNNETYDYDSGISLQALTHTLASVAVQLGAIDYNEASADFGTQTYPGVMYGSSRTRDNGQRNSYGTRFLYEMEREKDDDWVETPTILDIVAVPGKRASFGLRFISETLTDRFTTETTTEHGKHTMKDFNVRIDIDDKSPSGYSVDIGRDERSTASLSRKADPAGKSLQTVRPEKGSHFTDHFEKVTQDDMDEFIQNLAEMLRADAEMDRLDRTLSQRQHLR